MRGEKDTNILNAQTIPGSPPHARGKVKGISDERAGHGITPACAGKSHGGQDQAVLPWDHPRMRGEKSFKSYQDAITAGSPPHARGKGLLKAVFYSSRGITPACAGKSAWVYTVLYFAWDHPRMRGEKLEKLQAL